MWVKSVEQLVAVARTYPQSAYCAFTHSLSCEWSYLQRVIEGYDEEYFHLCDTIQHVFTPAVLGREVLERKHELFTLPVKLGGFALTAPLKSASHAFSISMEATSILQVAVQTGEEVSMAEHTTKCRATEKCHQEERGSPESIEFTTVARASCNTASYAPLHCERRCI